MIERLKENIKDFFIKNKYHILTGIVLAMLLSFLCFYIIGIIKEFQIDPDMIFYNKKDIWLSNKENILHPGSSAIYGFRMNSIISTIVIIFNIIISIKWMIKVKTQFPVFLNIIGFGGVIVDEKGTFGSASWMTKNEMKKLIKKGILNHERGIVIGSTKLNSKNKKDILVKDGNDRRRNKHTIIFGGSGAGKSYAFSLTNLIMSIREKRSFVCTDPKGELFKILSRYCKDVGMNVKKLNLLCPKKSNKFNPFAYITSTLDAFLFVHIILDNTSIDMDQGMPKGDPFWEKGETNLLKALTLYIWEYEIERNKNMPTLYDYIVMDEKNYDQIFSDIPNDKACKKCYKIFKIGDDRVRQGIQVGLASRLQIFQLDDIREMMSENEIDLLEIKKTHSALFVLCSDTHSLFDYIMALLFNFAFIKWAGLEDAKDETCSYYEIDVMGEEIANIGRIPKFDTLIATLRSRLINIMPIFQDSDQIKKLYPKAYNTIIGNCDVKIFMGGSNAETNEEISTRLGNQSIQTISKTKEKLSIIPARLNISDQMKRLKDAAQLEQLNDDEQIVLIRGQKPMKLYKYGWVNMPEYETIKTMIASPIEYMSDEFIPEKGYSI